MRVTNNMIMTNAGGNINSVKELVNKRNTQMTTQKKISRASEDPVVAIRSLRLNTTLSQTDQYYEKNIPDATSWLDVTETALTNMKSIISDFRTLCVNGSTDTLTSDDRNTIYNQLKALQQQLYDEGNADYAGRTVFTGYHTDSTLTFDENASKTKFDIKQNLSYKDLNENRYYTGSVTVPSTETEIAGTPATITETDYNRLRLGYDMNSANGDTLNSLTYTMDGITTTFTASTTSTGTGYTAATTGTSISGAAQTTPTLKSYATEADWAADTASKTKTVDDDGMVMILETGELVLGKNVAANMKSNAVTMTADYTKTGFKSGELKPEYYYNCTDETDASSTNWVTYQKYETDANGNPTSKAIGYDIDYTISENQELSVNLEASDVFDSSIYQDMTDMINAVSNANNAHDKLDSIKKMLTESQYSSESDQTNLKKWQDAAQKEADYADNNLKKMYSSYIGNADTYLSDISLSVTKVGCKTDQLKLTKQRMSDQQQTVQDLQSKNDDVDLSDIIIKYSAAYTAYQSSLTAAGKLGSVSLLNYLS